METKNQTYSGTLHPQISKREQTHASLARRLAAEGMVLLKNEGILPLCVSSKIALLGSGAVRTIKGGTGSGDVNNRRTVSVYQGLKEAGVPIVSEKWLADYESRYEEARDTWKERVLEAAKKVENPFGAYADNPFALPEGRRLTEEDIAGAKAAVYVISRISGEGRDRRREEGDYYLSRREREDILYLCRKKLPLALLLNTGGPVELTDILREADNIKAVLYISQPGQEGGRAAADVLLGKASPGGRLTATWAERYEDYPCSESYSYLNGYLEKEEYREGIYVGYRYFDRMGKRPLFPFGYGLSYTSYALSLKGLRAEEGRIRMEITVENTGTRHAGREVVQVYATLPQRGEPRECKRLAGFAKTGLLRPGERETVTIAVEQKGLASFSRKLGAWYLEAGEYGLWLGRDSLSLRKAAVVSIREQVILERTHRLFDEEPLFAELGLSERKECAQEEEVLSVPNICFMPQPERGRSVVDAYAGEQTVEELIPLLYGNITQGAGMLGSAGIHVPGSAGETTEALEQTYGIPSLIMADGPAGLRLRQSYETDRHTGAVYGVGVLGSLENGFLEETERHKDADIHYQYCTAFPVGTALAQMWDCDLLKSFGEAIAAEMEEFHVDLWLAPGMNIQRNPLCGRNFEYFSEDPLLAGLLAAAITEGVQRRPGCGVTIKHFACNNQEDNRMGVDARISERAFREIYARGFEIAVKKSVPAAIMSSYNKINGIHAANSKALCTVLAREEWGFEGVIMSDWNTTCPENGSVSWQCAAAGNDVIMPGNPEDDRNIREAWAKGELSEEEIRRAAGRVIALTRRLMK